MSTKVKSSAEAKGAQSLGEVREHTQPRRASLPETPDIAAYTARAARDEALIPDKQCEHRSRLRTCAMPNCISTRAGILKRATRQGLR